MSTTIRRFLVLNWKWNEHLPYPRLASGHTFGNAQNVLNATLAQINTDSWIPAVNEKELEEGDLSKIKQLSQVEAFVLPVNIWANGIEYEAFTEVHTTFMEAVYKTMEQKRAEYNTSTPSELLVMLHRAKGYLDLATLREKAKEYEKENKSVRIHIAIFGGGYEAIYDFNSFLDSADMNFRMHSQKGTVWFNTGENEKRICQILKRKNFDFTWDYYVYQTRKKIEYFRKEILLAQIPGGAQKCLGISQNHASSLLHYYDPEKYEQPEYEAQRDAELDEGIRDDKSLPTVLPTSYRECLDLSKLISDNAFDKARNEWLSELDYLAQNGKFNNPETLNSTFDTLLRSWYKNA